MSSLTKLIGNLFPRVAVREQSEATFAREQQSLRRFVEPTYRQPQKLNIPHVNVPFETILARRNLES